MKTLTFIRHAESVANAGGVTMPNELIPLSLGGQAHAQQLANALDLIPSQILTSSFLRTQETAKPFCQRWSISADVHGLLDEFCILDPALIEGMDLAARRPITEAYWNEADPDKRMGSNAETFREFADRVMRFEGEMGALPDGALIFTHGMWMAFLVWRLLGFGARIDEVEMRAFRHFQLALPMLNCAVYVLEQAPSGAWAAVAKRDAAPSQSASLMVELPHEQ